MDNTSQARDESVEAEAVDALSLGSSATKKRWYQPTFSPEHGILLVLLGAVLTGAALAQTWTNDTNLACLSAFLGLQAEHPLVVQIKRRRQWRPRYLFWAGLYGSSALALALYSFCRVSQDISDRQKPFVTTANSTSKVRMHPYFAISFISIPYPLLDMRHGRSYPRYRYSVCHSTQSKSCRQRNRNVQLDLFIYAICLWRNYRNDYTSGCRAYGY